MTTKICTKCFLEKPISEFGKNRKKNNSEGHYLRPSCIQCERLRSRTYHHNNKEQIHQKNREWRISSKYGISIETYNSMMESQNMSCAICLESFSDSINRRLAVDHDHTTGAVRGLLCGNCNNGLGRFKDNVSLLKKAIEYLEIDKNGN